MTTCLSLEEARRRLSAGGLKIGERKRLELAISTAEALSISAGAPALDVRRAWLESVSSKVSSASSPRTAWTPVTSADAESIALAEDAAALRVRCRRAALVHPDASLVRSLPFGLVHRSRDVGCAELLLLRLPAGPEPCPPCRICLCGADEVDEDECCGRALEPEALDAAVEALVARELEAAAEAPAALPQRPLPRGRLLRDVCACRGSAAAAHEGCLAAWVIASRGWSEQSPGGPRCPTCRQPWAGAAAVVIARLCARLHRVVAHAAAAHAAATAAERGADDAATRSAEGRAAREAMASLQAVHNESVAVWRAGRFAEAAGGFRAVLGALSQHSPGGDEGVDEEVALLELSSVNNLGLALFNGGALAEAAGCVAAALAAFELRLGRTHPNSLKAMHNVAMVAAAQGRHESAEASYEECHALRSEALGEAHADTLLTLCNLGLARHHRGQHAAAEEALARCEALARRGLGPSHATTLAAAHNRALALAALDRRGEALAAMRAVLEARRAALGAGHGDTLQTLADLAATLAAEADGGKGAGGQGADGRTEARALLLRGVGDAEAAHGEGGGGGAIGARLRADLEALDDAVAAEVAAEVAAKAAEATGADTEEERASADAAAPGEGEGGGGGDERGGGLVALLLHVFIAPAITQLGGGGIAAARALQLVLPRAWAAGAEAIEARCGADDAERAAVLEAAGFAIKERGADGLATYRLGRAEPEVGGAVDMEPAVKEPG